MGIQGSWPAPPHSSGNVPLWIPGSIIPDQPDIADTLTERHETHGDYREQAGLSQTLQAVLHTGKNWPILTAAQAEALTLISVKLARILTGDQSHADSWHDIAGYATLVERDLTREGK